MAAWGVAVAVAASGQRWGRRDAWRWECKDHGAQQGGSALEESRGAEAMETVWFSRVVRVCVCACVCVWVATLAPVAYLIR